MKSPTADVAAGAAERRRPTRDAVVDMDVHNAMRSRDVLLSYLPKRWHEEYSHIPGRTATPHIGARPQPDFFRRDAFPARGGPAGSDLELMREQYLDPFDVEKAVLSPLDVLGWPTYGEISLALNRSLNEWMVEEWLERDSRLYGAISVPLEDAERAAEEIARAAIHPRFVMVLLLISTREPLGHPKYWPIFEAADDLGLPVAIHVAGFSGTASAAGLPTYFVEAHTNWVMPYTAQTVSLVYSGVLARFPRLHFVLEEGGIGWVPPLLWRLDRAWEALRDKLPHLDEPPSTLVRRRFAFTTQPLDEPERPEQLAQLLDHLGMDDRILYSSDYPHWDFDDPHRVLTAASVGSERRARVLGENARHLVPFDRAR